MAKPRYVLISSASVSYVGGGPSPLCVVVRQRVAKQFVSTTWSTSKKSRKNCYRLSSKGNVAPTFIEKGWTCARYYPLTIPLLQIHFVVLRDMKCINDFLHIQPHLAEVPRKWKWGSRESRRKIILSYNNMCHLNILKWPEVDSTANADSNQTSTIRKTCAGVEVNNVPPWIMSPRTLLTSEYCPPRHYSPVNNVLSSEQCPPSSMCFQGGLHGLAFLFAKFRALHHS